MALELARKQGHARTLMEASYGRCLRALDSLIFERRSSCAPCALAPCNLSRDGWAKSRLEPRSQGSILRLTMHQHVNVCAHDCRLS